MHRHTRSEAGDLSSPRSSRAASFTSDRPSVAGSVTFQMPVSVRPVPAYIAASVASEIVTEHINEQLGNDNDPESDAPAEPLANVLFSEQALRLLNGFLDHLLFAFLSSARSPALTAIRPAITEVLKSRLAREAFVTADDELQGLLAGEDEEEFPAAQDGRLTEKWDVEKVWKRTRLRIMVYTRLGELEDEDEERYVQQERGLSMDESSDDEAGLVSWASAIFLTSVIEYVAEQALVVSGQAAYARTSAKLKKMAETVGDSEDLQLERIIVEDFDVEKLALNSGLGRLWRTWRKRVRSPITPISPTRGPRYMSSFSSLHRRRISHDTADESILSDGVPEVSEYQPSETEIAANIPIPIPDNDIAEIEVPGLARDLDEEDSRAQTPVARPQRPSSVIMLAPVEQFRRRTSKERPLSMPPPGPQPFVVPPEPSTEENNFVTPMERMSDDGDSYIMDEQQEHMEPRSKQPLGIDTRRVSEVENDPDMVAFAASTGMGFGMSPMTPSKSNFDKEDDDTVATPVQTVYDAEPQVLESKRMSIEKSGPPGIVRTFSTRSQKSSLASPSSLATPKNEGTSYLDDAHSDDDLHAPDAIGVAHTTNVPIPTPSPPDELATNEQASAYGKQSERSLHDNAAPRHFATPSTNARKTPSPEDRSTPPERSLSRKDVTPPKSRGTPLTALQEKESWAASELQRATPEARIRESQRGSTAESPQPGSSRWREIPPVASVGSSMKRKSVESSPRARTVAADGFPVEKSTLQRVSSSSSTTRSVSTSILHSARDSEISLTRPLGLSGRMSEEDREREFDTLVKSEDTVKYTLTPQSMRDLDEPPVVVRKVDPTQPTPTSPKPSASVTVYPPVSADPTNSFGAQPFPARTASLSKAQPPSSRKVSGMKPLAREPRIQAESMRDFADFIRSTGPAPGSDDRPVQPFVSLSEPRSPNGSSSALSGLGRRASTKQSSILKSQSNTSLEGPSAKPRIPMEPRSPAGQRSGNDDLIDFIRQGPPGQNNGQPRIPRSVAPFRTTVDSDQFDRMLDENGVESAFGSQVSTVSKQSTHTSNSRTGLLATPNVVQPAYSNTPQKLSGSLSSPEPHIQRTRRRVKDPYAIDSDDEDEDLLTALPKSAGKPRQQEESLLDFLNSQEPPSNSAPQPFLLDGATVAAAKARMSINQPPKASSNSTSSTSTPTGSRNGTMPSRKPMANQLQPTIVSNVTSNAPRARGPKLQARDPASSTPRNGRSATNDLADFLRTSGPPESAAPAPGPTMRKEEAPKSSRKFWRKKTYPDMP
ncbi:hypothetical protein BDV96DRAFT_527593 [Lophiotrema nucula]|uniref:Flo11 n=1 Tax=Lophiotrema nucula TaxID=690887 RepID=A0A6A5YUU4_9PLEO|nr:hypothetical protein BDV96DRAFT_527593 [Lophiotrema nucula]